MLPVYGSNPSRARAEAGAGGAWIILLAALALALVIFGGEGCSALPRSHVLLDETIPHRLAESAKVSVWVRRPDGQLAKERVEAPAGWWLVSPRVVEP